MSIGVHSWFLSACFAYFAVPASAAVFTTNALLSEANTTFDGQDIVIDGNITVTIDGPHAFNSLLLTNGTLLTHSPCSASAMHKLDLQVTNEAGRASRPNP